MGFPREDLLLLLWRRLLEQHLIWVSQYTGPSHGLWSSLDEMVGFIEASGKVSDEMYCLLAISCLVDESAAESTSVYPAVEPYVGPYFDVEPVYPGTLNPQWHLLGYDVADGSRLSGLSNCGLAEKKADSLRVQWASDLNRFHLFDDPERASQFALLADERVPEHASFFVYSLRLISGLVE